MKDVTKLLQEFNFYLGERETQVQYFYQEQINDEIMIQINLGVQFTSDLNNIAHVWIKDMTITDSDGIEVKTKLTDKQILKHINYA